MPKRMATARTGCRAVGPMTRDRRSRHALELPLAWLREWQIPCQFCRLRRLACHRQTASTRLKSVRCFGLPEHSPVDCAALPGPSDLPSHRCDDDRQVV
ncbi:hypothetical protein MTO96_043011 [Rhipicephalus appendiculatus]